MRMPRSVLELALPLCLDARDLGLRQGAGLFKLLSFLLCLLSSTLGS